MVVAAALKTLWISTIKPVQPRDGKAPVNRIFYFSWIMSTVWPSHFILPPEIIWARGNDRQRHTQHPSHLQRSSINEPWSANKFIWSIYGECEGYFISSRYNSRCVSVCLTNRNVYPDHPPVYCRIFCRCNAIVQPSSFTTLCEHKKYYRMHGAFNWTKGACYDQCNRLQILWKLICVFVQSKWIAHTIKTRAHIHTNVTLDKG